MVDNEAQSLMTGVNVERIGFPSVDGASHSRWIACLLVPCDPPGSWKAALGTPPAFAQDPPTTTRAPLRFPAAAWAEAASADITTRALALAAPEPAAGPAAKEAKPDSKARRLLALQTEEPPAEKMQAAAPAAAPGMVMAEGYDEAWLKHIINGAWVVCSTGEDAYARGRMHACSRQVAGRARRWPPRSLPV